MDQNGMSCAIGYKNIKLYLWCVWQGTKGRGGCKRSISPVCCALDPRQASPPPGLLQVWQSNSHGSIPLFVVFGPYYSRKLSMKGDAWEKDLADQVKNIGYGGEGAVHMGNNRAQHITICGASVRAHQGHFEWIWGYHQSMAWVHICTWKCKENCSFSITFLCSWSSFYAYLPCWTSCTPLDGNLLLWEWSQICF
jgi:hypothetical protein